MKLIEVFTGLFLNSLLFLLSYVVPKRPGTLLLGGGLGHRFAGNTKYFYLYLCRASLQGTEPFRDYAWITKNRDLYQQLLDQNRPALHAWSPSGFWRILRAEQLLIESGNVPGVGGHDIAYERVFPGRFRVFQTWHGTPLKRICLDVFRDRGALTWLQKLYFRIYRMELSSLAGILALSDVARERFATAFDNSNIAVIGYPKNDVFFGDLRDWDVTPQWQAFDRVLLYAPTYRDEPNASRPFSPVFFKLLNDRLSSKNWCLLIKKHHFDATMHLPEGMSHIFDISGDIDDIQEVLVQTDLLISDYSSTFIDYLLKRKPVIFYIYDLEVYLDKSRRMYCEYLDEVPGPFARTEEELMDMMFSSDQWFEEDSYQKRFKEALRLYHKYWDGDSCLRFQDFLLSRQKRGQGHSNPVT